MTPPLTALEGMVAAPESTSQRIRPDAASTAVTPAFDWSATRTPLEPFDHNTGDVQFAPAGRFNFQRFVPLAASNPAAKDSLSFSICATRTPSANAGDEDMPRLLLAFG